MVKDIIQIGNKLLNKPSQAVDPTQIKSPQIQELINDLIDTCKHHDQDTAGLSAVQIGEPLRIFVARRIDVDEDMWDVFINPEVKVIGDEQTEMWEGCMSIGEGDARLFGPVVRPDHVKVEYLDREGNPQSLDAQGYMAHIIEHEDDHLHGKLFLQYITDPSKLWKSIDLDKYIQKYNAYPKS